MNEMSDFITEAEQECIAELQDDIKKLKKLIRETTDEEKIIALNRQVEWNINAIQKIVGY
jgi:hypothetical protein